MTKTAPKSGQQQRAITIKACLGVIAACCLSAPVYAQTVPFANEADSAAATSTAAEAPHVVRRADFKKQAAPDAVRHLADWIADSGDNGTLPFVIVDKQAAKVFVFDKNGQLLGSAWALIGLKPGDDSVPEIGTKPLTAITPDMRTTPAGRFVAALGHDLGKLDVLWVDYRLAVSLHRVINTDPKERRLERIVSQKPDDHRISYGCINVPAKFFDSVVDPAFKDSKGVVYILPEVKDIHTVFPSYYEVDGHTALQTAVDAPKPVPASDAKQINATSVEN